MVHKIVIMPPKTCKEPLPDGTECGQPVVAHGLCPTHYQAARRRKMGYRRVRTTEPLHDTTPVFTRVSKRTGLVLEYLRQGMPKSPEQVPTDPKKPRSTYDLAREWLEERAEKEQDPPDWWLKLQGEIDVG